MTQMAAVTSLVTLIVLLSGCRSSPSVTTAEPPPQLPAAAHERGVAFLVEHQNDDGSWGSFVSARPYEIYLGTLSSFRAFRDATSSLCVMALLEPSRTDPAAMDSLQRGIEFLLAAKPTARATADTFYDTWTHTYLVHALSLVHQDDRFADLRERIEPALMREIETLCDRQGAEGGWAYYDFGYAADAPTGNMSTSFNTASALLALHEARNAGFDVSQSVIDAGLLSLERLRLPSGAFVYGTYARLRPGAMYNRVKGSLGRSQSCNLALRVFKRDITRENLLAGLNNLREEHHFIEIGKGRPYPHEAWYATAGYYFLYGHYHASRVIDFVEPLNREEYRTWLAATMARLQNDDGSWFDFPLYGYHKFYGTAFALLTLQHCGAGAATRIAAQQ